MTDAARIALQSDPSGFVNSIVNDGTANSVDVYLDALNDPSPDELANMMLEEMDNEEVE